MVEKDLEKSVFWLEKSADEYQNPYAAYALGKFYADPEQGKYDPGKAVKYYELSAEKGNDMAMYQLGQLYLKGEVVEKDLEKSVFWLSKAADEYNNSYAQYVLGNQYFQDGDVKRALDYWHRAADQGNDFAMWRIGHVYLWGIGIEKDTQEGLKWLHKSADEFNNEYAKREIEMYEKMPLMRMGYGLFKILFSTLSMSSARKNYQMYMRHERSRQAQKEIAMHRD